VPPIFFFAGAAATLALGTGTVLSAVDTSSKHDAFTANGCDRTGSAACDAAANSGASAQTRTNVLIVTTAVFGIATIVLGTAFTRWSEGPARVARIGGWSLQF
jgi:hypothetical protein